MRKLLIATAIVGVLGSAVRGALPQTEPSPSSLIVGVWKGTSTVTTGAGASANPNRQPNVVIYTKKYYSLLNQDGGTPLPARKPVPAPKDPNNLTDAEKLARYELWDPLGAQSGTYEVTGDTLVAHPIVEKAFPPSNRTYQLEFKGHDTMVQSAKSADGTSELRRTFVRLE